MRLALLHELFPPDIHGGCPCFAAGAAEPRRAREHELEVQSTGCARAGDPETVHRSPSRVRPFGTAGSLEPRRPLRPALRASAPRRRAAGGLVTVARSGDRARSAEALEAPARRPAEDTA